MNNKVKGDSLRAVTRCPSVLFLLLSLSITLADRHAGISLSRNASSLKGIPVMRHLPGPHDLGLRPGPDMRRQDALEAGQARVLGGRQASAGPSASGEGSRLAGISPPSEAFPHTSSQGEGSGPQPHSARAVSEAEDSHTQAQAGSRSVNIPSRIEGWQEGSNLQPKELSTSSRSPSPNDVASSSDTTATETDNGDNPETLMAEYTGSVRQTGYRRTPIHQANNGNKITDYKRTAYPNALAEENTVANVHHHSAKTFPPGYSEYPNEENEVFDGQPAKDLNDIIRNVTQPLYSGRQSDRETDWQTDRETDTHSQFTNKVQTVTADILDIQTDEKDITYNPGDNNTDITYSYSYYDDDYYYTYQADYCKPVTCHLSQDNVTLEHEELSISEYKIVCNSSFSLTNLSFIMKRSCAFLTTQLVVTHQMELCVIMKYDLSDYRNLINLSITNTALNYIEDRSFGNLVKLQTLDLRNNQLLVLSWRSLWPHAIPGQGLRSINASGNPLLDNHCGNLWLLKWQQKKPWGKQRTKEGHREEGKGEGEREEVEEGEMREEGAHGRGRRQGGQKTKIEMETENGSEGDGRDGKDGKGRMRTRRREKREGWTQDTRDTSQVLTTEDCPSPGNSHPRCYLCAASLKIVNETGSGPCRQFILTCSVSGEPKPHIEWDIPPHLTLLHHDIDNLSASSIASTAMFVLNMTELVRARHLSPLACVASNEMYVSVEKINIDVDPNLPRNPVVCLAEYINTSPTILYFETQAVAPWNVTWWFYPCVGIHPRDVKIPLYTHPTQPGSSSGVGYFKFQDTPPTGHYEILLRNAYGNSTKRRFISNRPPNSVICQDTEPVAIRVEEQTLPPVTQMPPTTRTSIPPCSAPSSTTTTTTASTTGNAAIGNASAATTDDSFPIENSTVSTHGVPTTIAPTLGPTHLSISIVLTIVAGVMVVVIGVTWLLLRNLRWPRDRSNMESDPCPDSPFQINFIGCLCRDEECQKKHEGLHTQELMPISAERLVDNPEYIGNGIVLPSKPQVKVIPRDKVKFVSELGEGAFGRVYLGVMEEGRGKATQVAVKTLKSVGPEARVELEREVELLSNLTHANIVSFYGVCYSADSMLMVFEYMEHGDLNNYLRSHNEDVALQAGEEASTDPISVMDCLQIALQVAAGMKYLASQHYVHRDLATRNCLVGANLVVKIGDFGMSRDVYTTDYYQFGGRTLLPVRWMPPESILYRRFTIESDIWSFGVVLWEIFTGGKQPWYGYNNQEVITQITGCKVLSCPDRCPPDMYRIMVSCWRQNPQERPSMATLYAQICSLITVEPHVLDYD